MIILIKKETTPETLTHISDFLIQNGITVEKSENSLCYVWTASGNTTAVDEGQLMAFDGVIEVRKTSSPYPKAAEYSGKVTVGNIVFGEAPVIIAGPCSVESEEQITEIAQMVKKAGATMLRGGAFKPRTSPYSFQGLGKEGIDLLVKAKKKTGLPVVSEITDISQLEYFNDVDIIQVGARNMQNFSLLKELGANTKKPILLKRGMSNTVRELLLSAEYIMKEGNENIILCERGIRTFETATRNTMDISAIPVLKSMTNLPVIADPSHGTGLSSLVTPMSMAAIAAGANGLIIEVHNRPENAVSDGVQALNISEFSNLVTKINKLNNCIIEK